MNTRHFVTPVGNRFELRQSSRVFLGIYARGSSVPINFWQPKATEMPRAITQAEEYLRDRLRATEIQPAMPRPKPVPASPGRYSFVNRSV